MVFFMDVTKKLIKAACLSKRFFCCEAGKREQRVFHPETTFERLMLQCLEKGALQNQVFDDPGRIDQKFMRAFVGAFLRPPR